MNFRKKSSGTSAGFQIAPMLDIMFILLIFFMASTIFAQWENKLGIQVPVADSGIRANREPGEVIVNVDAEGKIYINSQEISLSRLESLLGQIAETFKSQPIIIRADQETRHKYVIDILDVCRKVDIWNIAFSTIPREDAP
ncbi:MAG: biopolymer transporter ExbD [Lentisphaeria bacterium]